MEVTRTKEELIVRGEAGGRDGSRKSDFSVLTDARRGYGPGDEVRHSFTLKVVVINCWGPPAVYGAPGAIPHWNRPDGTVH